MWFCLSVCVCMYMFAGLSLSPINVCVSEGSGGAGRAYSANLVQKVRKCLGALHAWRTTGTRIFSAAEICDTYSDWSPTNY
jgi:hypothetical protein